MKRRLHLMRGPRRSFGGPSWRGWRPGTRYIPLLVPHRGQERTYGTFRPMNTLVWYRRRQRVSIKYDNFINTYRQESQHPLPVDATSFLNSKKRKVVRKIEKEKLFYEFVLLKTNPVFLVERTNTNNVELKFLRTTITK